MAPHQSRRFWTLVAVAVVDGALVVIPVVAAARVRCAPLAPDLLRRAARFLEELAEARGSPG